MQYALFVARPTATFFSERSYARPGATAGDPSDV
jgi:hypothetical protein